MLQAKMKPTIVVAALAAGLPAGSALYAQEGARRAGDQRGRPLISGTTMSQSQMMGHVRAWGRN